MDAGVWQPTDPPYLRITNAQPLSHGLVLVSSAPDFLSMSPGLDIVVDPNASNLAIGGVGFDAQGLEECILQHDPQFAGQSAFVQIVARDVDGQLATSHGMEMIF